MTLVYPNKTIALNCSPRKDRRGEYFDPSGLVSLVLDDPSGGYVSRKRERTQTSRREAGAVSSLCVP